MLEAAKVTLETALSSLAMLGDSADATDSPTLIADGLTLNTLSSDDTTLENDVCDDSTLVMTLIAETKVGFDSRIDEK